MSAALSAPAPGLRDYCERHHIDRIPAAARHGKPWHQFLFWFGANTNVFNVLLGGIVVQLYLTFYWALVAIGAGTLIGALLIALHATQGPRLGVPQTIQSRGQFGFYGAAFMFPLVLFINVGFIAAQLVLQGQSLNVVWSHVSIPVWVFILAIPAGAIGIFGYRWVHYAMQVTGYVVGASLIIMFIQELRYGTLPASQANITIIPPAGAYVAAIALFVIDLLTFGPFVSDYTRYLPQDINGRRLFWAIFSGNVLSTFVSASIGALMVALVSKSAGADVVTAIAKVCGPWALIFMALSLVDAGTFNAYTGSFQLLAFINMWRQLGTSLKTRLIPFFLVLATGTVIALIGYQSFVTTLSNYLQLLLMFFIPWSAVNLADYFLIRSGQYDVNSFFRKDGAYGKFAWRGFAAYLVGLAVEWPFVSQVYYTGPLVHDLGGADISWIVGFFVAGIVYLALFVLNANRTDYQAIHAAVEQR